MHKRLADKDGWVAQACESLGVPGPNKRVDPKQVAAARAADSFRKQMIQRVTQFNAQSVNRQTKTRSQLEREYRRMANRFKQYDFQIPALDVLIENPKSWQELDPKPQASGTSTMTVAGLVEDAYLRTLSRFPDDQEREISEAFIHDSPTPAAGMESILWALVNTKEFIITH